MASLVLGAIGSAIGGSIGGAVLGLSSAAIGGAIGTAVGGVVDQWLLSSLQPGQRIEGQRLESLRSTTASEGGVIPRVFGRMRLAGNLIWATDFREERRETSSGGGKGSRRPRVTTVEYLYSCSFAVALCEGVLTGLTRVWADGEPLDMSQVNMRWYPGDELQTADPLIAGFMGSETPAYRGTAYVVFEDLPLAKFGNRVPQLTFEVYRALAEPDSAEGLVKAVTLIPATGEFAYGTSPARLLQGRRSSTLNVNSLSDRTDLIASLDQLQAACPGVESVTLVVSWFGTDLRCGNCQIRPGVESANRNTTPAWRVNGVTRSSAYVVSQIDGKPAYGGTPSDDTVVACIQELRARGLRVTFYPFILMDIPPGNTLPNPYSDNASGVGQPTYPWRGRITCSPAAGFVGSVDKTAAAQTQVNAFAGSASIGQFSFSGTTVNYSGPAGDWGYRRFIYHYMTLCKAAGGVDAFLIGTELRGLTTIRSGASTYPFPAILENLALIAWSQNIPNPTVGGRTSVSYAADWSEYFGHQPQDGSGDLFYHLDGVWSSPYVDFVGIDNYMPLSDWRDGFEHLDALGGAQAIYDRDYLQSNIEGGEGFDWFYASSADRAAQVRTPITDGLGQAWVFRFKDLRSWWDNRHQNRPGGVPGSFSPWFAREAPIRFTEFGCPAVDRGTNQPNVFFDPKSAESFVPFFSRGWRDDAIQRAYLEATLLYWSNPANNPVGPGHPNGMVEVNECAAWTWDARPYPFFPALSDVWSDADNWLLGHWLGGRLGSCGLGALVRELCRRAGMPEDRIDVSGLWGAVEGFQIASIESPRASIASLGALFGFDGVESEGVMRFRMRGRAAVASLAPAQLVRSSTEVFELTRAQETELPRVLKWQVMRSDEDYDLSTVEARRGVSDAARVESESFPVAVPPEEAERWCRRSLQERWVGREAATMEVPVSRLALDPGDVIALEHDGRSVDFRIESVADGQVRRLELRRMDREAYDMPPGSRRAPVVARPPVLGGVEGVLMDLPILAEDVSEHQPLVAAVADPWPGDIAVFRSQEVDGFELFTAFSSRVRYGTLEQPLAAGPLGVFDVGNVIHVEMEFGALSSVSDTAVFGGANTFALQTPAGWEIVQAATATLVAPGRYQLSRLLRGQRGTEDGMVASVPAGAAIYLLDATIAQLPVATTELGRSYFWRIGPAVRPVSDEAYDQETFTPSGRGLRPFSPVLREQPRWAGYGGGDLTIRWIRRDRALGADSWELVDAPMSEAVEAYEVDILSGSTVLRTLTSSTPSVLYTAAQQTADFGSPRAPGGTLSVRIVQMSAAVGRGVPLSVTLLL